MNWRQLLLRVLRVPPDPDPPPGSPPRLFRAAPSYQKLLYLEWFFLQLATVIGLLLGLVIFYRIDVEGPALRIFQLLEAFAVAAFIAQLIGTLLIVRLKFELRWYMVSDRAIRIREGITTVREKTIAFANIQNIAVRQGPLERLLGIANVEVKTAGGGAGESEGPKKGTHGEPMHVAYFRGVDNEVEIRDLLREGVRLQRDAGLGDPDDHHHQPAVSDRAGAIAALREEAHALRRAVERH